MIHEDMNLENGVLLHQIPQGCSMDKGKGYDVNDWLYRSSISQRFM